MRQSRLVLKRALVISAAVATSLASFPRLSVGNDVSIYQGPGLNTAAPTSGNFNAAGNWSPNGVPSLTDINLELDFSIGGSAYTATDDLAAAMSLNEIQFNTLTPSGSQLGTIATAAGDSFNFVSNGAGATPTILQNGTSPFAVAVPMTTTNLLTLGIGSAVTSATAGNVNFSGAVTNNGGISITGGNYTLSGAVTNAATSSAVINVSGGSTTISGVLAGTFAGSQINVSTGGSLSLTNTNTFQGDINVDGAGSNFTVASAAAFGGTGVRNRTVTLTNGGTFSVNAGWDLNVAATFFPVISVGAGGGTINQTAGTLLLNDLGEFVGVAGANLTKTGAGTIEFQTRTYVFPGAVIVNQGIAQFQSVGVTGTSIIVNPATTGITGTAGAELQVDASAVLTQQVTLNGSGIAGNPTGSGALFTEAGAIGGVSGQVVLGSNNPAINASGTLTLSGGITDNGSNFFFSKTGTGNLIVSAPGTYGGGTLINAGTLTVTNTTGSALGTGPVGLSGGTVLASGPGNVGIIAGNVSGFGTIAPGGVYTTAVIPTTAIGSLTIGSLTANTFTNLNFDLTTPTGTGDILKVTSLNGVSVSGTVPINFGLIPNAAGQYHLVSFLSSTTPSFTAANFSITGTNSGSNVYSISIDEVGATNQWFVDLNVTNTAAAGPYVYTGTSPNPGDWTNATNWTPNAEPGVAGDVVTINNGLNTPFTINLNGQQHVGSFTFGNTGTGSYTLAAGPVANSGLFLDSGTTASATLTSATNNNSITAPVVLISNSNISVAPGTTLTMSGQIGGPGSLTLSSPGAGTGVLLIGGTAANTYTGGTFINGGTARLAIATGLAGTVAVAPGGALDINNFGPSNALTLNGTGVGGTGALLDSSGAGNPTVSGTIGLTGNASIGGASNFIVSNIVSGAFALTKTGANTVTFTSTGNATFSGGLNVQSGTIIDNGQNTNSNLGTGPISLGGGGTGVAAGLTISIGGRTETFANALSTAAPSGPLTLFSTSGIITFSGPLTLGGSDLALTNNNNTANSFFTLSGNISGTGNLTLTGSGTGSPITLSGVSINNAGTISNLATTASSIATISGGLGPNVTGVIQNSTIAPMILSGNNVNFAGTMTVTNGTLQAGSTTGFSAKAPVVLANTAGAVLNLNNFNNSIGPVSGGGATGGNITLGTANLTINQAAATTTYAGVISGTGGVTVTGTTGTLILSGTQTYTGPTAVNGATLSLQASNTASPSFTVNATGTLASKPGANISIAAPVTINTGGTLAPGGIGNAVASTVLTLNNNLTLNNGAAVNFDFGTTTFNETIALASPSNIFTINGNPVLTFTHEPSAVGNYLLFNDSGAIVPGSSSLGQIILPAPPAGDIYSLANVGAGQIDLVVTAGNASTTANYNPAGAPPQSGDFGPTNTGYSFNSTANWDTGVIPHGSQATANFGPLQGFIGNEHIVTLDAPQLVGTLVLDPGGGKFYDIQAGTGGGSLAIVTALTVSSGQNTVEAPITFGGPATLFTDAGTDPFTSLTIGSTGGLSSAFALTKTGNGSLTVNGPVSLSAGLTISGGSVQLTNTTSSNTINGSVSVASGATFRSSVLGTGSATNGPASVSLNAAGAAAITLNGSTFAIDPTSGGTVGSFTTNFLAATSNANLIYEADFSAATLAGSPTSMTGQTNFANTKASTGLDFNDDAGTRGFYAAQASASSFLFRATGTFKITNAGIYQFQTSSDDASKLYIDNRLVVLNDGGHGVVSINGLSLNLSAGLHEFRVDYEQGTGGDTLYVDYAGTFAGSDTGLAANTFAVLGNGNSPLQTLDTIPTGNNITLSSSSTINTNTSGTNTGFTQVGVGKVTFNQGTGTAATLTVAGLAAQSLHMAGGLTLQGGAANTLNFTPDVFVDGQALVAGTGATTLVVNGATTGAEGPSQLFFTNTSNAAPSNFSNVTIDIKSGRVVLEGSTSVNAGTANPIAGAAVQIDGGTLVLDSKDGTSNTAGSNVGETFDNAVSVITSGTIEIQPLSINTTLGSVANGINIGSGQTLTFNPLASAAVAGATMTVGGNISGSGTLAVASQAVGSSAIPGVIVIGGPTGALADAAFTGNILISNGFLQANGAPIATPTVLGTGSVTLVGATSGPATELFLKSNGTGSNGVITFGGAAPTPVTITSTGATTIDVNSLSANTGNVITLGTLGVVTGATLNVTGANTYSLAFSGATTLGGNTTFNPSTANVNLAGGAVGVGSITKTGAGTLTIPSATSNYGTTAAAAVGTANGVTAGTGTEININGGILGANGDLSFGAVPANVSPISIGIAGGTLQATSSFTLSSVRGISLGGGTNTIDVTGTNVLTYNGIMNNPINVFSGFTKIDTGTLVLGGISGYVGADSILNGTIVANATGTLGGSPVTFGDATGANNASLLLGPAGGVTIGNNVTARDTTTGTLTLGGQNVTGTNTFSGSITLGSTAATAKSITISQAGGGETDFTGNILANGASTANVNVVQTGTGTATVKLTGSNTFTGLLTVNPNVALATRSVNDGAVTTPAVPTPLGAGTVTLAGGKLLLQGQQSATFTNNALLANFYNSGVTNILAGAPNPAIAGLTNTAPNNVDANFNTLSTLNAHLAQFTPAVTTPSTTGGNTQFSFTAAPPFGVLGYNGTVNYEMKFTGQINFLQTGTYTFSLNSDDGSNIWIDNAEAPVVSNNFYQGAGTVRTGTYNVTTPGWHNITIAYYEGGGGESVVAGIQSPTGTAATILNAGDGTSYALRYPTGSTIGASQTYSNPINITADSGIDVSGSLTANVGAITLGANTLSVTSADTTANPYFLNTATFNTTGAAIINVANSAGGGLGLMTITGTVQGTGGITKTGVGTLLIAGSAAFSGTANANGGMLAVYNAASPTLSFASAVVNTGGKFGGNATLNNITVNSGGTLSPSIGVPGAPGPLTLSASFNLTFNPGSTLAVALNSPSVYDQVDYGGAAAIGSGDVTKPLNDAILAISDSTYKPIAAIGDTFYIVDGVGFGSITPGGFSFAGTALGDGATFTDANNITYRINYNVSGPGTSGDVSLTVTDIPEPGSLALLGVSAAGLLIRRRRRS